MTHVWVAETFHKGSVCLTMIHATAQGARNSLVKVLDNAVPGYRETSMGGPYDEGECEFIMPGSFETVGTVRKCSVGD